MEGFLDGKNVSPETLTKTVLTVEKPWVHVSEYGTKPLCTDSPASNSNPKERQPCLPHLSPTHP